MSKFIRSNFLPNWVRSFTASFGVTVLMLASAPWSTAFAWDPAIELMLTTVDPALQGVFTIHRTLRRGRSLCGAQKERLGGWSLVNLGVTAGEKVNLFARTRGQTGIGSVRLELTGSQTVSRTDNTAPFTLFEDHRGNCPAGGHLPVQCHRLSGGGSGRNAGNDEYQELHAGERFDTADCVGGVRNRANCIGQSGRGEHRDQRTGLGFRIR